MMKRTVMQATGEVQKVGYRDFVQKAARKLGVVGTVENMRDGSVQIICEGEEEVIEKFKKAIKVKKDFIVVKNVRIVKTGKASGKLKYFDIKYGSTPEEIGDRMGAGRLYIGRVEGAVDSMHTDINTRFDNLDSKYGEFGKDMKALRGDISDMKLLTSEFSEFKDLFAIYVKHQLEKDSN